MVEDGLLEALELIVGLETELLVQQPPPRAVDLERVCLAAAAVQGQHQLATEVLAERVAADEPFELGNELHLTPEREIGIDALLKGGEPLLVQPETRITCERGIELGEWAPAPQRKRLRQ